MTTAVRKRAWILAALTVLASGLAGSLIGAHLWRSRARADERRAFQTTAADVTATLRTLVLRDADFVSTVRGVLTMQPDMGDSAFARWYVALQGKERQVGSIGTAVVKAVPAPALGAFLRKRNADPAFRALVGAPLPISRGAQPRYCLLAGGKDLSLLDPAPAQLIQGDWCSSDSSIGMIEGPLLQTAADWDQFIAFSVPAQGVLASFIEAPFYRRGAALRTPAERRAATAGWTVSTFDILDVIRTAIGTHRRLSVALYHTNPGQPEQLIGQAGPTPAPGAFSEASTASIYGPWRVVVRGPAVTSGLPAGEQGLLLFLGGAIVSLLLALLVAVLGRSHQRALVLVARRTGQLRHQEMHDSLTGLPNRTLAVDRAEQMLARARRQQLPIAALYLDVDGFKHINDTFGHAAGDEFLRIVAARLHSVIRDSDTAARVAGDEFLVLLDSSNLDVAPQLVAERLLEVLREPSEMTTLERQLTMTASIGVAYGLRESAEQLIADADVARNVAKSSGKDRYVVFESGMQTAVQDRLTLEMDLSDALASDQLFLVYQPTVDLQSEQPIGAEALLRWRHPERGLIGPDVFIPIAEESGLIVPIGRWVLEQACQQAAAWSAQGHRLGISVNVSGRQLDHDGLIDDVRSALTASGLPASALTVEITETALMRDADGAARRLLALKDLGVRLAIDDFGTGYSSLGYLRQFDVDCLKIDRSFVRGIAGSSESAALINTLVRLGKSLNLDTLAEGIEDQDQLRALQRQSCDHGQGYLFAKPLEPAALSEFLAAQKVGAPSA